MTMEAVYFKERQGGFIHNPTATSQQPLWWPTSGYGVQSLTGAGDRLAASKLGSDKGSQHAHFTISPGDGPKPQAALPEYYSGFEPGFSQAMMYAKYPFADPCYGVVSANGPQGRIMLPLDIGTNDVPIFVNPKQYHAIMKSRERRAKAELKNKQARSRKPYMHESRHLHAMRRPRGCGGRFLNSKNQPTGKGGGDTGLKMESKLSQPSGSQTSEVLQSDSGTLSSPRGMFGSITSLSPSTEVTSNTYAREDLGRLSMNCLRSPFKFIPVSGIIDTGHGIVMPSTWVTAGENCRDLKV